MFWFLERHLGKTANNIYKNNVKNPILSRIVDVEVKLKETYYAFSGFLLFIYSHVVRSVVTILLASQKPGLQPACP